jgi:hypothetical protein
MTDSVFLELKQVDDATGEPISKVSCEWYGMDRNVANALSMGVSNGIVGAVTEAAEGKAEVSGDSVMVEAFKKMRKTN